MFSFVFLIVLILIALRIFNILKISWTWIVALAAAILGVYFAFWAFIHALIALGFVFLAIPCIAFVIGFARWRQAKNTYN